MKIFNDYTGDKPHYIQNSFLNYDRYYEALLIKDQLVEWGVDLKKLKVLDFGCGVGDYGMLFLRNGSTVKFFDDDILINFVQFRLQLEELIDRAELVVGADKAEDLFNCDLVIFGEVLDHVTNPVDILQSCVDTGVKYIWTTSYPYRAMDDNHWNKSGHTHESRDMQPACQKILEDNYHCAQFTGQMRLWKRKEQLS